MSGPSDSPTPSGSPFAVLKNFTSLYNRGAGIRSPSSPRSNKNASNSERKKEKSSEEKENADNVVLLSDSSQSSKTKSSAGKSSPELRDEWKERTTVITKNDHENNVHIAKEVLEDVVLDIKTPEKDSLPINYLERSNYESESDASFNSFASALQTSFDHKQHRKNIDSDEDYESAADADLSVGSMLVSNHHGSKQFSVLKSMDSCDVDFMTDLMNKISLNVKEDISQVQKEDIISTSNPTFEKYDNPKKEEIESGHLIDENNISDKNVMTAQSSRCQMSVNDSTELSSDTMCDSLNIKCSIGKEIEEVQSNPSLTKKKISDCENTVILVRNKCSDSNLDSQSFSIGHDNDYIISNEENKTNALEQTTNSLLSHSKTTINVTQSGEFEKLTIKTNSSSESPITMMEDPLGKNEKPISECISVVKNNHVKSSSSIKENDSDIFLEENQSLHQDDSPRCSVKKGVDMNDTVNIDSMTDSNLESTTIIDTKKLSLKPDTSSLEGINPISVIKGNQESLKNENACTDQTQVNDKNVFEDHNTDPIPTKTKILFEDDQNKFDDPFVRKSKITMEENIDQFDDPNFDPFVTKSKIQMGDEQVKFDDPNFDPFATKSTIQMEEVLNHFDNLNIDPFVTKSQIAMEAVQTKIDDPNFDQFDIKSKIQLEEEQDKFDDSNIDPFVTKSKILMGDDKDKLEDQNIDSCITKPKIAMEGIQNKFHNSNIDPVSTKSKIPMEAVQNKFDVPDFDRFATKSKIQMEEEQNKFDNPNIDSFATKSKIAMEENIDQFDDPNIDPFATKSKIAMEENIDQFDDLNIDPFATKSKIQMEEDPNVDPFATKSKIQMEEQNIDPLVTKSKIPMGDDQDKYDNVNIDSVSTKSKITMEENIHTVDDPNIDPFVTKSKIPMGDDQDKYDNANIDTVSTESKITMEENTHTFDHPNIDPFATKSKIAMEENIDQFDDPNIDPFATKSKIQMEEDPNVDPFATKSKIQMEEQNIDPLVTKSEIPMGDDQDKYDNANIDSVSTKSKITMEENIHTVDDPNIDPFATKSKIAMEEYIDQFDDPNIDPFATKSKIQMEEDPNVDPFATKSKIQMEEDPNVDPFATKSKIPMGDDQDKYDNVNIDSVSTKSKITLEENIHAFDDPNIDPFATKSKIAMEKNIDQFDDPNIDPFTTKSKIHTGDDQDEFVDANIGPVATKSKITMEENIDTFDDPNIDPFATKSKIQMEEDPNIDPLVTKSTIHLGDDQDKFDDPNIDPLVTKSRIPVCDDQDKFDDPNIDQFATKSQIQFGEEQNIDPLVTKCKILVGDDQDKFGDPNVDPFVTKSKIQMEEDPNFDKVATKSKIQIEEEQNKFDDLNVDPFLTKSKIQMEDYPDIDVSKSIIPTGDDIGKYDTKSKIQIEEEQNKLKDTFAAKSKISMDESIDQFDDPNFDPFLTKSKIQMGNNQFEDPNIDQFATKSKLLINENINQINHPNVDPFETKSKIPMKDEQDMFEDPNINPFTTKTKIRIADDYLENSEAVIYDSNVPKEIENTNANFAMSDLSSVDPLDSKAKRVLDTTIDITSHPSNNKVVTNNCNIMDIDNINVKAHKKDSTPEFEATEKSIQNESACVVENKDKRRYDFDMFKNEASKIVQSLESKNNVECLENQTTNRFKNQRANEIIDSVQFCKNSIKHALNISSAEPSILLGSGGDFEDCDSICMSNYTNASVSQVREHRTRSELIWQAKLLEMDKEIDTIEKETASMDRVLAKYRYELAQSDKSTQQMMDLIECYEKTAIDIIRERERDRAVMDIEHEKLICERNTLLEDRRSSERAHNDVQRKYERMREVITDYKRNEDELKDVARNISDKCELSIKKYSVLKSHVEEKIKEANYDFEELQAKNKCEIVKLQALSRKADMKNVSLGNTLEQKMSENRELNIICDELINK
nr:uncharacterized protein LOC121123449 isoform X8 [Lepeophtheirus salmonis]